MGVIGYFKSQFGDEDEEKDYVALIYTSISVLLFLNRKCSIIKDLRERVGGGRLHVFVYSCQQKF